MVSGTIALTGAATKFSIYIGDTGIHLFAGDKINVNGVLYIVTEVALPELHVKEYEPRGAQAAAKKAAPVAHWAKYNDWRKKSKRR